ncbi:peroxiredoxin [Mycoavidus sp. B2-EB]|uniref:peroxiredoxin n=1 Tax=Mycoavidus sp. B2-EB TaxID=2651972 RepID=UPI00162826F2|nr:peroxiredoxin [Mycoavidus sp. B2-EB]BBO59262.1 peroxiredoxin [Mycoavidus sp. B2-EB]
MSIALNQAVPEFSAAASSATLTGGEEEISLSRLRGKNVVLYFYPKDNTPGCTTESQDFRDAYAQFKQANTEIIGISRDSLKSHQSFQAQHNLPFSLISDPQEKLCALFEVIKLKNMYGKEVRGIERSTFLLDAQGVLRQIWRGVKVPGHVTEVLDAVHTLAKA